MSASKLVLLLAGAAALPACEARIGNDAPPVEANASAAGKAEEGRLTISAQGFNMSIDIPEGLREHDSDDDDDLLYPGAALGGLHVQAGAERADGARGGEVELRFTTGDAPDRVAAWYRDPARQDVFTVQSAGREGEAYVVAGTGRRDNDRFTMRVTARAGGGSEGRLLISDRT